jgi:hypothetical protein
VAGTFVDRAGGVAVIYVASSWRNDYQPAAVAALRAAGHEVYDFKDSEGFNWREVDPDFDSNHVTSDLDVVVEWAAHHDPTEALR